MQNKKRLIRILLLASCLLMQGSIYSMKKVPSLRSLAVKKAQLKNQAFEKIKDNILNYDYKSLDMIEKIISPDISLSKPKEQLLQEIIYKRDKRLKTIFMQNIEANQIEANQNENTYYWAEATNIESTFNNETIQIPVIKIYKENTENHSVHTIETDETCHHYDFSPDENMFTYRANNKIHILNLKTNECVQTIDGEDNFGFSPDSSMFAYKKNNKIHILNPKTGNHLKTIPIEGENVDFEFSNDSNLFAYNINNVIHILNLKTNECVQTKIDVTKIEYIELEFSNDDQYLEVFIDNIVGFLNLKTNEFKKIATVDDCDDLRDFSPDFKLLVIKSEKVTKIFDTNTGELLQELNFKSNDYLSNWDNVNNYSITPMFINGFNFSKDSSKVAIFRGNTLYIWNKQQKEPIKIVHKNVIQSVQFCLDDKIILVHDNPDFTPDTNQHTYNLSCLDANTGECLLKIEAYCIEPHYTTEQFIIAGQYKITSLKNNVLISDDYNERTTINMITLFKSIKELNSLSLKQAVALYNYTIEGEEGQETLAIIKTLPKTIKKQAESLIQAKIYNAVNNIPKTVTKNMLGFLCAY